MKYENMTCRECGQEIKPRPGEFATPTRATSYAKCIYICPRETCRCAYSNARRETDRKLIYPDIEKNIPTEVVKGVLENIKTSLNEISRGRKIDRLCFSTSEDALTWTVIRYLKMRNELVSALNLPESPEMVFAWGTSLEESHTANSYRKKLESILSQELGENKTRFSEPDLMLIGGDWLVFVEVKYQSKNDKRSNYEHFGRYLKDNMDLFSKARSEVEQQGYYELTRNWVIGNLFSRELKRNFCLINLGPNRCEASAREFERSLRKSAIAEFKFADWKDVIEQLRRPVEPWFMGYIEKKFSQELRMFRYLNLTKRCS